MNDMDIAVLFARDPLKLTRDDITKIIAALRAKRIKFGEPRPTRAPAKRTTKKEKLVEGLDVEISL